MREKRLHLPNRRGADPWSRAIVRTLAVNAMLVAVVTWAAVARASEARDEDRRAVLQTVQSELVRVAAQVQAHSENSSAAEYLVARAQAGALVGLGKAFARDGDVAAANAYTDEADTMVAAAEASAPLGFSKAYLGSGRYNFGGRQKALINAQDWSVLSADAPDDVTHHANMLHTNAGELAVLVVVLVGGILVLTVARVVHGRARLRLVVAAWCLLVSVGVTAVSVWELTGA